MKKRAMKKWIPKNACYCYNYDKNGNIKVCKWSRKSNNHSIQDNGYCMYIGKGDWQSYVGSLLWDQCKECGVKIT